MWCAYVLKISPPLTMNFIKTTKKLSPFVIFHFSVCFNEHYKPSRKWQFYIQVMQKVVVLDMYTSIIQSTHDQESSIFTIYDKAWSPFINYVNTWIHNHYEQAIFKAFKETWNLFPKKVYAMSIQPTMPSLCSKCNDNQKLKTMVGNQKFKTKVSRTTTTSKFIPKCNGIKNNNNFQVHTKVQW